MEADHRKEHVGGLNFTAGVIMKEDILRFKRMIFRATRGIPPKKPQFF